MQSGQASVRVEFALFDIDQFCNTFLESIHAPDCDAGPVTQSSSPPHPSEQPSTESTPQPTSSGGKDSGKGVHSAKIGGIIGGIIVGILLALLVVMIVVVALWKKKNM